MTEFKDKMNEYIERSGISKTVLANITGVNERTVDRGCKFLIRDSEKYKALCSFLSLSQKERQELDDLYIKTQFSDDEFVIIDAINDLLLKFNTLLEVEYHPVKTEFKKQYVIEQEENICAYIMHIIRNAVGNDCKVSIYMKNPVSSLLEMLSECIRYNDRIQLELVTAFETGDSSRKVKGTIQKLCSLLTLFRHPNNVEVKYFYSIGAAVDFPFPIAVIINSDVIAIDDECSTALHFDSDEIIQLYKKQYDKIYKSAMTLVRFMDVFDYLCENVIESGNRISALQSSCCIYKYLRAVRGDKYIKDDVQNREKIVEMAENYAEMVRTFRGKMKIIFTYKGLENFMKSGKNIDFPQLILKPMCLEDRLEVLKGMLENLKNNGGHADDLMLKQNLLNMNFSLQQSISYINSNVIISYIHPQYDTIYALVDEECISNAVKMYFKYLEKSRLTYSTIETIDYLTSLLEECQRKGEEDNA